MADGDRLPREEQLAPGVRAVRVRLDDQQSRVTRVLEQFKWPSRVIREYRDKKVTVLIYVTVVDGEVKVVPAAP